MIEVAIGVVVVVVVLLLLSMGVDDHPYQGYGHQPTERPERGKIVPPPPPSRPHYVEGSEGWLRLKIGDALDHQAKVEASEVDDA